MNHYQLSLGCSGSMSCRTDVLEDNNVLLSNVEDKGQQDAQLVFQSEAARALFSANQMKI